MSELSSIRAELERLKKQEAEVQARQSKLAAIQDAKEKAIAASAMELDRVTREILEYQLRSGQVSQKLLGYVIRSADNPELEAMKAIYRLLGHPVTGVGIGDNGLLTFGGETMTAERLEAGLELLVQIEYPKGWLCRLLQARSSYADREPALQERLSVEAALAPLPEVTQPLTTEDGFTLASLIGADPLTLVFPDDIQPDREDASKDLGTAWRVARP